MGVKSVAISEVADFSPTTKTWQAVGKSDRQTTCCESPSVRAQFHGAPQIHNSLRLLFSFDKSPDPGFDEVATKLQLRQKLADL